MHATTLSNPSRVYDAWRFHWRSGIASGRTRDCSSMALVKGKTISVIPGTGKIGALVGKRLAEAGFSVILGSRDASKAEVAAAEVSRAIKKPVKGASNADAAAAGDVVFWTPSGSLADREALLKPLAKHLQGKVIIDTTNILYFFPESQWGQTSSTLLNQEWLGVPARWTTAFKNTFAQLIETLPNPQYPMSVLVSGDDDEAVAITIALVDAIPGFKGVKAGPLKYSKIVELLGPPWGVVLNQINTDHQPCRTGLRIGD